MAKNKAKDKSTQDTSTPAMKALQHVLDVVLEIKPDSPVRNALEDNNIDTVFQLRMMKEDEIDDLKYILDRDADPKVFVPLLKGQKVPLRTFNLMVNYYSAANQAPSDHFGYTRKHYTDYVQFYVGQQLDTTAQEQAKRDERRVENMCSEQILLQLGDYQVLRIECGLVLLVLCLHGGVDRCVRGVLVHRLTSCGYNGFLGCSE